MTAVRFASATLNWHTPLLRVHDRGEEMRAALLLLCAALLLGRAGPPMPGIWIPAEMIGLPYLPLAGLSFVWGIGAAAYALARASESPPTGSSAALPAMLAALLLLPGMGAMGLVAPLAVALVSAEPLHRRLTPLLAAAIALAYLGQRYFPLALPGSFAALGATVLCWREAGRIAANDNPSLERILTLSERTPQMGYGRAAHGDSESEKRELRDVQG